MNDEATTTLTRAGSMSLLPQKQVAMLVKLEYDSVAFPQTQAVPHLSWDRDPAFRGQHAAGHGVSLGCLYSGWVATQNRHIPAFEIPSYRGSPAARVAHQEQTHPSSAGRSSPRKTR